MEVVTIYPYRIRTTDKDIIFPLLKLLKNPKITVPLGNKNVSLKLGHKLSPIRKDVFIGRDNFTRKRRLGIDDMIKIEKKKWKNGFDFIFTKKF